MLRVTEASADAMGAPGLVDPSEPFPGEARGWAFGLLSQQVSMEVPQKTKNRVAI